MDLTASVRQGREAGVKAERRSDTGSMALLTEQTTEGPTKGPHRAVDKEGLARVGALQEPKPVSSSVFLSVNFGAHDLISVHWPERGVLQ